VAGHFAIWRNAADRLELGLWGELAERDLLSCEAEVRAQLSVTKAGGVQVLVDLLDIDGYSLQARDALVALQRFLGAKASQTAFIADSTRGRGLALWISHMTEGQVIESFNRREDATAWLARGVGRVTGLRPQRARR
jgi:hypothetical protein